MRTDTVTSTMITMAIGLRFASAQAADWPALDTPVIATDDAALVVSNESGATNATLNAEAWVAWLARDRRLGADRVTWLRDGDPGAEAIAAQADAMAAKVSANGTFWIVIIGRGDDLAPSWLAGRARKWPARTVAVVDHAEWSAPERVPPNLVVLAGASGPLRPQLGEPLRPAFSYLALGALRGWADGNGDLAVTADEVVAYVGHGLAVLFGERPLAPRRVGADRTLAVLVTPEPGPNLAAHPKPTKLITLVEVTQAKLIKRVEVTQTRLRLLERIVFKPHRSEVDEQRSSDVLDQIAYAIEAHPEWKLIEVQGHFDGEGRTYAGYPSRDRARSVVEQLVRRGVDPARLIAKGYGETRPIASNVTPRGRDENRRIEIVVIDPPGVSP